MLPIIAHAQTIDSEHELLWEISGNGAKTSYLFGTMHTNDKRAYNLSDSTYFALNKAEVISLEVDIFSAFDWADTRIEEVELKYDREGEPYTSRREGTETSYGNEDGMPQPLDAYFQQYCHNAGKDFAPLESVESQQEMLTEEDLVPDWSQLGLETILANKEDLLQLYLSGDIYALDIMVRGSLKVFPEMYDEIIVKRNFGMMKKLDSLIQDQVVFCAVGAGHLAGSGGIINLLRGNGYSVRKVISSYNENESEEEKIIKSFKDYTYNNDTLGFHAIFPGRPLQVEEEFDEDNNLHLIYRDLGQGNAYEIEVYNRTNEIGLEELAGIHIASPEESTYEKVTLDNGGEAYQGLGQTYWDGLHWVRVIMSEEIFLVIKAYGGNKFMSSPRAFRFFDKVWID